jgi:CheY-like chemotaxis protein
MPDMNGWETLEQVHDLYARLGGTAPKFIMLSANARDDLQQRTQAEQDLVNAFLIKPVTASMLLDASLADMSDSESLRRAPRSSMRRLAGMRILVVEDNAINQQVAEELLSYEGALVSIAGDGRQGVNAVAAAKRQFDAVLMDVQMPVMDGYAATRAIREQLQLTRLPIIGLTANAMASDRDACIQAGMSEHIGKPFDMAQLIALLLKLTHFAPAPAVVEPSATSAPVSVPTTADIDLPAALARLGGMKNLYVRSATELGKGLQTLVPTLEAQLERGALTDARALLHTFKGNAGTMGLTRLHALLAELEKTCSTSSDSRAVREQATPLAAVLADALTAMQSAIAMLQGDAVASPEHVADPASLRAAVALLQNTMIPLLKNDDLTVLEVFANSRAQLQHLPADSLARLDEALQGLDLAGALDVSQSLVGRFSSAT